MTLVSNKATQVSCICAFVWAYALSGLAGSALIGSQDKPAARKESDVAQEHFRKAKEAYDAGHYSSAKQELKRALSLDKQLADAYLLLGMTYWQEGKGKEAVDQINTALQYRSNYPEAHYYRSVIYWKTESRAKALEEIDLAIRQGASSFNAYYLRGQIELADAKYDEALESFEQAARLLTPNHSGLAPPSQTPQCSHT